MGPAQSSLLGLGATVGVAASKISQGIGELKAAQISEANDATKNEMMAQRAKINAEQLKNLKLRNKKLRLQNRALKEKQTLRKDDNSNSGNVVRLAPQPDLPADVENKLSEADREALAKGGK